MNFALKAAGFIRYTLGGFIAFFGASMTYFFIAAGCAVAPKASNPPFRGKAPALVAVVFLYDGRTTL